MTPWCESALGSDSTQSACTCSGTRDGAKTLLGVDTECGVIERDELPPQLDELSAREVEDFLCIYRHRFDASALGRRPRPAPTQRRCWACEAGARDLPSGGGLFPAAMRVLATVWSPWAAVRASQYCLLSSWAQQLS